MLSTRALRAAPLLAISALVLAACGSGGSGSAETSDAPSAETSASASEDAEATDAAPTSVTIEDNYGTHTIELPLTSVVATDNRTFQTLAEWDVPLTAAAVSLMPPTNPYTQDTSIVDTGNHREPNLEAIIAAEPDLIIVGQRYAGYYEDIVADNPDSVVIALDPREGEPWDAELKRQTDTLAEIFGKQAEAKVLTDNFDQAIERVNAAYDPADKVMAVNVSNGNIGYISADEGRTLGEAVRFLNLTESFSVTNPTMDHEGEEVSVEAIADSNPDWLLVLDRSAAVGADDDDRPAVEIIESNEALANVTAVKEGRVIVMQPDAYLNESIQMYTAYLNAFADALEAKG